jgi:hypothetical protein
MVTYVHVLQHTSALSMSALQKRVSVCLRTCAVRMLLQGPTSNAALYDNHHIQLHA